MVEVEVNNSNDSGSGSYADDSNSTSSDKESTALTTVTENATFETLLPGEVLVIPPGEILHTYIFYTYVFFCNASIHLSVFIKQCLLNEA